VTPLAALPLGALERPAKADNPIEASVFGAVAAGWADRWRRDQSRRSQGTREVEGRRWDAV